MGRGREVTASLTTHSTQLREAHPNLAAERSIQEGKFSLYCTSMAENFCLHCTRGSLGEREGEREGERKGGREGGREGVREGVREGG